MGVDDRLVRRALILIRDHSLDQPLFYYNLMPKDCCHMDNDDNQDQLAEYRMRATYRSIARGDEGRERSEKNISSDDVIPVRAVKPISYH